MQEPGEERAIAQGEYVRRGDTYQKGSFLGHPRAEGLYRQERGVN